MSLKTRLLQLALILFISGFAVSVHGQSPIDGIDARANTADLAKQLASSDPLVRQRSAEALAQLAATDQRKIVEGYALEEKNKDDADPELKAWKFPHSSVPSQNRIP